MNPVKCPVCDGQGHVWKPPYASFDPWRRKKLNGKHVGRAVRKARPHWGYWAHSDVWTGTRIHWGWFGYPLARLEARRLERKYR